MGALKELLEHGQSCWLDNLTRWMIREGDLAHRVSEQGVRGVTSNPNIFHKAIGGSADYDGQIEELSAIGYSAAQLYEALTTTDVREACDILRPVHDESGGRDGFVSLEVSPHLAFDTRASIEEARRLWRTVDRPNLLIKIPGTSAGVPAVEQLLYEGINVNITLLFSVASYESVAEAYLRALERRVEEEKPVQGIASVASFFLSRIDVLVDKLLGQHTAEEIGVSPGELRGEIAIANGKLAYQSFKRILQSERWQVLAKKGARPQRMLWASTGTKNPSYSDVMYVEPLIGPHTVNTMPGATIAAFVEHGRVAETVEEGAEEAKQVMADLERLGIRFDAITEQLQNEGVQKFIDPYDATLEVLETKRSTYANRRVVPPLRMMARKLRRHSVRMTTEAGSGHATSALSCADIVSALFFYKMRWDPAAPHARNVDTFVLSKGHAAPVLWAALYEAGAVTEDPLTLRRIDSTLEGHPTPRNPWVRVATGALGQGLAAANGMALANRLDGIDANVYCLLGDGECSEGSVWEAAQFASLQKLDHVVAIVDVNALGQSGPTPYRHDTATLARRFEAFGWKAIEVDGHDIQAVLDALDEADHGGPTAIIARTIKGKGVSFLEGALGWHGKALPKEDLDRALDDIGEAEIAIEVERRHVGEYTPHEPVLEGRVTPEYAIGDQEATRSAFGNALVKLGELSDALVVLDGDVKNSTKTEKFAEAWPKRFFEGFIAEQNMAGAALGLSSMGKVAVAASFACFLSRAYDFIRMAGHSRPEHLVFCGSHAGVSIGEDGPSQMGLEDMAMFRSLNGSTVLYPADAVSAERLTEQAVRTRGIVYIRTTRGKTPVIYPNATEFPVGGSHVLKRSDDDRVTLVAAGITLHEALAAHESLARKGIVTRVIDAYSVKPLDIETLMAAARETKALVVVEDHWPEGGLGEAVAAALSGIGEVHRLAVTGEPRSGKPDELLERHGISRGAIERRVLEIEKR